MLVSNIMQVLKNLFGLNKKISASEIAYKDSSNNVDTLDNYLSSKTIYDSGSNSNGNWVRFTDGTMICHKFITGADGATQWSGTIYYHDVVNGNWSQNFKTILNVQVTNTTNQWWCCISGTTETSAGTTRLIRPDSASSGQTYNIHIMAVGKWK